MVRIYVHIHIHIHIHIYVGLLRSTDSKTANTRLGATKPQTKANTTATRVSRGSKRGGVEHERGMELARNRGAFAIGNRADIF